MADINALKKKYSSPDIDIAEKDNERRSGNVGLPFGLCKKYGIDLPNGATPRQAWEALKKEKGITPQQAYDSLKADNKQKESVVNKKFSEDNDEKGVSEVNKMLQEKERFNSKTFTKDRVKKNLDYGTPEMKSQTSILFNEDSFGYSDASRETCYNYGFNAVTIRMKMDGEGEKSAYSPGAVFYHETWHAIDANYGEEKGPFKALSNTYKVSSGKTLQQTLTEEANDKEKWKQAKAEVLDFILKEKRAAGEDVDTPIKEFKEIRDRAAGKKDYWERMNILFSREYEQKKKAYEDAIFPTPKAQRIYGDLSDIYSGTTGKPEGLAGMGHDKKYWKDDPSHRGKEAFAEIASAKACSSESYNILKKYMPETVKAFEEIYLGLKGGRIKSNGRPKYQP